MLPFIPSGLGRISVCANEQYIPTELNMDYLMADNRLRTFSEFTGGSLLPRFITEFPSIFSGISAMLRNQYSIAYNSSNTKRDGKFRKSASTFRQPAGKRQTDEAESSDTERVFGEEILAG